MNGLDFSELDDDQLLALIRAALREAADRHPGVAAAAKAAMLDEQERMRIIVEASERASAADRHPGVAAAAKAAMLDALRAKERERVAAEAAARVHEEHAAMHRATTAARAADAGREAREKAEAQQKAPSSPQP